MTKVYIMTHKKVNIPKLEGFTPLHVGRACSPDLGYIGDDTGDNISRLNCYYGELTGLYWIWKNVHDNDNVAICHYRRFFGTPDGKYMNSDDFDSILSKCDVITPKSITIDAPFTSYRESYNHAHHGEDLDMTGDIIKELYPQDYHAFCTCMDSDTYYFGNLCAMPKHIFDDYCAWLFGIFDRLFPQIDFNKYEDDYHRRVFGFISEQLLKVWITARDLHVYECPVYVTDEKAETKELKLAIGQLIRMNNVQEAAELFMEVLKIRPDVALELSDTSHEVAIIELILRILNDEKNEGVGGMLEYSHELGALIEHCRNLIQIVSSDNRLKNADSNAALLSELINTNEYLRSTHTSEIAVVDVLNYIKAAKPQKNI